MMAETRRSRVAADDGAAQHPSRTASPTSLRIADEIEALRAEKAALHEALVAGHRLAA